MSSVINWIDLIVVGPFLMAMSTGYYSATLCWVVGLGVIGMNLWELLFFSENSTGTSAPKQPVSFGQSKVEYSKNPQAVNRFPNAVFSRY